MSTDPFAEAEYENLCTSHYIGMSDGTQLKVLTSQALQGPISHHKKKTLMLVPGWGSIVPGWDELLLAAAQDFDLIYLESREKDSSILNYDSVSDMNRLAQDIQETITHFQVDEEELILVGSCIGGNTIAYGLLQEYYNPAMVVLIGPQLKFPLPWYGRFLIPIAPHWLFYFFKPLIRLWVKLFKTSDKLQAAKYIRVVNEADSKKWKKVGKAVAFEKFHPVFPQIQYPIYVVGENNDKMHDISDALEIAQLLPNSTFIVMDNNDASHSAEMVEKIQEILKDPMKTPRMNHF